MKFENLLLTIPNKEQKWQQIVNLENQLKLLQKRLDEDDNLGKYNSIKNELDAIYDCITEVICIRSKCGWYMNTEKNQ